jgi:predicted dehydrogenase/threonine dehydrogenase-like Zn-dependent dehydrogenase
LKQVIQSFKTGQLTITEVPSPTLRPRGILVRTHNSLVSAGTERMVVDFAEKNMLQKARARPDLVRQVMDKAKRDGWLNTLESVRNRLAQPMPLGYSAAGVITAVGADVIGFSVGDRVACAGGGFANHAELLYIPRNLAVKLSENVSFEEGAFATLGAIALQGIRQGECVVGHKVAVIGLGLLGQLTVQMLKASGCAVFGVDLNPTRVALALQSGADAACQNDQALAVGQAFTHGRGFDAVLITADTKSNGPVALAGHLARDRAIVVAVGAVGMGLPRKIYYEKELDFRLSRSYGPGRYDPDYEDKGIDYPYGYVRFTQQRNLESFLDLVACRAVNVEPLISHRFHIDEASNAYEIILGKTAEPFLGVLLRYDADRPLPSKVLLRPAAPTGPINMAIRLGVLGAGNFANASLLPALENIPNLEKVGIASGSGLNAQQSGERFGFAYAASEADQLLQDPNINWIAIMTRHDLHASQAVAAMNAGKDVFIEKPAALNRPQLIDVFRAQQKSGRRMVVGFNRRFAPLLVNMKAFWGNRQAPLIGIYRVNAGAIPASHWTQDPAIGGGRIIGEACHFIDLLTFLIGAPPSQVFTTAAQQNGKAIADEVIINLRFADGSAGTVIYAAGGDRAFGKERIELFGGGKTSILDDFHTLITVADGKTNQTRSRLRTSKGHHEEWLAMAEAARTGSNAIPLEDIAAVHLASYAAVESIATGAPITVDLPAFWAEIVQP